MKRADSRPPQTPPQTVLYAVGDIHGRADLLEGVLEHLALKAGEAKGRDERLVAIFLGDYIDRGPDSRQVIEGLISFQDRGLCETVFLRGNHEQVVLDLLDGVDESRSWLEFGGIETLESYGAAPLTEGVRTPGNLKDVIAAALPPAHVAFMRSTELTAKFGDYLFVHAGLRPDRLVEEQSTADLLWFRYYDDAPPVHGEMVVHGHSTNPTPVRGRHRIGIDTEAYASGALTLLRLAEAQKEFLKVTLAGQDRSARLSPWPATDGAYSATPKPSSQSRRRREMIQRDTPRTSSRGPRRTRRSWPALVVVGILAAAGGTASFALQEGQPRSLRLTPPGQADGVRLNSAKLPLAPTETPGTQTPGAAGSLALRGPLDAEASPERGDVAPGGVPTPAAPSAGGGASAIRVQIGAVHSEESAKQAWRDIAEAFPAQMGSKGMLIEAGSARSHGLFRANVVGFSTRQEATQFCSELRAAGQACIIRQDTLIASR